VRFKREVRVTTRTIAKGSAVIHSPAGGTRAAMTLMTGLFFMCGFLATLNDILIPHLKSIFDLNYMQVMMVQ
jgi:FHS family L-fucose permease-like MFS transporter